MPRKYFRKLLPSHDRVRENRHIARFGPWLQHHNLWHLHRRSVAGGIAAGLFAGLIPGSNPVQFTAGALLAILFHVNLPIAVLVTLYSNPFTIVPLYYIAFRLGQFVLMQESGHLPALPALPEGKGIVEWIATAFDWLASTGKPLLVGLPLLAVLLAIAGYLLVDLGWQLHVRWSWRSRQRRRARAKGG